MLKALRNTVLAVAAVVIASSGAQAAGEEKAVEARQSVMKIYSFYMGQLGAMAKGKMEYNAKTAQAAADSLLSMATLKTGSMWIPGTGNDKLGDKTRAKPEIWSTYPEVATKSKNLVMSLEGMVKVAGTGLEGLRGGIGAVGKSCGGCHKPFRQKK